MKKAFVLYLFLVVVCFSVSAQGFYFDIGLGLGKAWTKVDGDDFVSALEDTGFDAHEIAVDIGFKAGYGPFGKVPLYLVGELAGMGHRIYDKSEYVQFNSYIIGPGLIFYPIPLIQLAASFGYSFVANVTNDPDVEYMYDSKSGFAWNISAALDLGKRNHGCLIGVRYFAAYNKLETTNAKEHASMLGVFIKYAYRKKAPSLF